MNVRSQLLTAFAGAGDSYISGAALAEKLGVSRNAVWKAVKALEAEGFIIESITSKGYRLSGDSNRLAKELICPLLDTKAIGRDITVLDEVDSTNNAAKELASAGAPHGSAVAAEMQTAGKGRIGRGFVSPAGKGLYVTTIVRPDFSIEFAPMITAAAACAGAEAVESLCGQPVNIKWVNDLYMNGRKICGILTEASMGLELKSLDYAVIGIGINVRSAKETLGEELSRIVTSVEDETGIIIDRNVLCARLFHELERFLDKIEDRSFLEDYRRRELLTGNTITASVGGESIKGRAVGIDDNANLMIKLDSGEIKHLSSGEANLCRIAE